MGKNTHIQSTDKWHLQSRTGENRSSAVAVLVLLVEITWLCVGVLTAVTGAVADGVTLTPSTAAAFDVKLLSRDMDEVSAFEHTTIQHYYQYYCLHKYTTAAQNPIEILIKFLESRLTVFSRHTDVIKINIPQNGGHFRSLAAIGRRNMPLNCYVTVSRAQKTSSS